MDRKVLLEVLKLAVWGLEHQDAKQALGQDSYEDAKFTVEVEGRGTYTVTVREG
jgi:hypothetical protein